jgi:hypothetical protein
MEIYENGHISNIDGIHIFPNEKLFTRGEKPLYDCSFER